MSEAASEVMVVAAVAAVENARRRRRERDDIPFFCFGGVFGQCSRGGLVDRVSLADP